MNLAQIASRLVAISKNVGAAGSEAAQLLAEIDKARGEKDPLGVHLFNARREWRRSEANCGKSTKRLEDIVRRTFFEAQELGFRHSAEIWRAVLSSANIRK